MAEQPEVSGAGSSAPARPAASAKPSIWRSYRFYIASVVFLLLVATYVVVVSLYAAGGRTVRYADVPKPDPNHLTLEITPQSVDGVKQRVGMDVAITVPDEFASYDDFSVTEDITILIQPVDGTGAIVLKKGEPVPTVSLETIIAGRVENWPFDRYRTIDVADLEPDFAAIAYPSAAGPTQQIPVDIVLTGEPPGWNFSLQTLPEYGYVTVEGQQLPVQVYEMSAERAGSIITFGIVLLALLVAMPTFVLFVSVSAYVGRRRVEATLTSWIGTMLFATISVRNFFPGSPPIGSWVDILIVLWVIVALVVGLGFYVAAWNRWGKPYPEYRGRWRREGEHPPGDGASEDGDVPTSGAR